METRARPLLPLTLALVAAAAAGALPAASSVPSQSSPVIVLVGDSTVTDDEGWGSGFRQMVRDGVEVVNAAAGGRSSKSFLDEGRWAAALARKGNVYLIQFGHNDEPGKGAHRETDPGTTFRDNLRRYVDEARAAGGTPILVTPLVRRHYDDRGTIRTAQTPYVEAVRAVAAEKAVPLVDLHAISLADAEHAGEDVWADLSPRDAQGQVDRTHLNSKGSEVVGAMVANALREAAPALASYLRREPSKGNGP